MALAYIGSDASLTAARMNTLFDELERKLAIVLGNKSFILGTSNLASQSLLGRCFYFTRGGTAYAVNLPDAIQRGPTSLFVQNYSAVNFEQIAQGLTEVSRDEEKQIITVQSPAASDYGFPPGSNLFDFSLAACKKDGYWIKPEIAEWPERIYKWAQAEIIVEGLTSVSIRQEWNKYNAFRIHNLNRWELTVQFGADLSFTIPAYESKCYRRNAVGGTYTAGGRYFQKFLAGDPRFWGLSFSTADRRPAFAHSFNNVSNPAILFRYIDAFRQGTNPDCWWEIDETKVWAMGSLYSEHFGDATNDSTLLGDLVHHRGTLISAHTVSGSTTFKSARFEGYGTISQQLSLIGVSVAENASGVLAVSPTDATGTTDLISIGSNLLKRGEAIPSVVNINGAYDLEVADRGYTLAIDNGKPSITSGFVGIDHNVKTVKESSATVSDSWQIATQNPDGSIASQTSGPTVSGPRKTIVSGGAAATSNLKLHTATVATLKTLSTYWTPSGSTFEDALNSFAAISFSMTVNGPALTSTATVTPLYPVEASVEADLFSIEGDVMRRPIKARYLASGWPYGTPIISGVEHAAAFMSPRIRRVHGSLNASLTTPDFTGETEAAGGEDASVRAPEIARSDVARLERVSTIVTRANGQRFAVNSNPDVLRAFLENYQTSGWYSSNRAALLNGTAAKPGFLRVPILREHWNHMAQAVNQLVRCKPLTIDAFRFVVQNQSNTTRLVMRSDGLAGTSIRPINQYAKVGDHTDVLREVCLQLSIPIKSKADLPASWSGMAALSKSRRAVANFATTSSLHENGLNESGQPVSIYSAESSFTTFSGHAEVDDASTLEQVLGLPVSAYSWISIEDVKAAADAIGFPFVLEDVVQPLFLTTFSVGAPSVQSFSKNSATGFAGSQPDTTSSSEHSITSLVPRFVFARTATEAEWCIDSSEESLSPAQIAELPVFISSLYNADRYGVRNQRGFDTAGTTYSTNLRIPFFDLWEKNPSSGRWRATGLSGGCVCAIWSSSTERLHQHEQKLYSSLAVRSHISSGVNRHGGAILLPDTHFLLQENWSTSGFNAFCAQTISPDTFRPRIFSGQSGLTRIAITPSGAITLLAASDAQRGNYAALFRSAPSIELE